MKKSTFFAFLAFFASSAALSSCSSDPEYNSTETVDVSQDSFTYDSQGVWSENSKPGYFSIDDFIFSHSVDDYGYAYGFTPSKATDTSLHSPLDEMQYASASGGGVKGPGSEYIVGYWAQYLEGDDCEFSNRTCRIYEEEGEEFEPVSIMVCNNTYLMYAALNGTALSPKFVPGDYVTLIAHGVHLDGTEAEVSFYLINIESEDIRSGILTSWKEFDLSSLGACTGIYFTMDCSDNLKGDYGMDIPSYFCLNQLVVKD